MFDFQRKMLKLPVYIQLAPRRSLAKVNFHRHFWPYLFYSLISALRVRQFGCTSAPGRALPSCAHAAAKSKKAALLMEMHELCITVKSAPSFKYTIGLRLELPSIARRELHKVQIAAGQTAQIQRVRAVTIAAL